MTVSNVAAPAAVRWSDNELQLLDQRRLPKEVHYLEIPDLKSAWQAIATLSVRGAPAIGIAAAYALAVSMRDVAEERFMQTLTQNADYLKSARPTAVNLAWAVERLVNLEPKPLTYQRLIDEAVLIHQEDIKICSGIGQHGASLIQPEQRVLTHCNAGALAVSTLGTATAPMYTQHANGVPFHVYVDETRPLYQGARLTAWELDQAGIDVTLICDNMAASLMAAGQIDLAIVGTDRVTANGDVVNKIGTLNVAILCHHFDIPFYVACPSSTYDAATSSGDEVIIEQRDATEVLQDHAAAVHVHNPAFDVTPNHLVTGIITEHGIANDAKQLAKMLTQTT